MHGEWMNVGFVSRPPVFPICINLNNLYIFQMTKHHNNPFTVYNRILICQVTETPPSYIKHSYSHNNSLRWGMDDSRALD